MRKVIGTISCASFMVSLTRYGLHGEAKRSGVQVSAEVARQGWAGCGILVVVVVIPSGLKGEPLVDLVRERHVGHVVLVLHRPKRGVGIQQQSGAVGGVDGVAKIKRDPVDRLDQ